MSPWPKSMKSETDGFNMKTKLNLLATIAWAAVLCPFAAAMDPADLPPEHLGARHYIFTATHATTGTTDEGIPTSDGFGYRDAQGTTELTISIPDLNITDLVIPLSATYSADRDASGNGNSWGTLLYEFEGITSGAIHFASRDTKISDTVIQHARQYAGALWINSPLDGARLLATETVTETLDGGGSVTDTISAVGGVLIVPFYEEFPPFEGLDTASLPPLKPTIELPEGMAWQAHVLDGQFYWMPSNEVPDKVYTYWEMSNDALGIRDLWMLTHGDPDGVAPWPGYRYSQIDLLPMGAVGEPCGRTTMRGVAGRTATGNPRTRDYMEQTGVFQRGPLAGCLYVHSEAWKILSATSPETYSAALLVPDGVELDLSSPQKMLNISERGRVGTGDDILIAGFVVSGKIPRTVLVRAIGPGLEDFGVADLLENPELKVFKDADPEPILINYNATWWRSPDASRIREAAVTSGAFPLGNRSNDAAILFSWLEPGAYTVQVSGVNDSTGIALAEVYEIGN